MKLETCPARRSAVLASLITVLVLTWSWTVFAQGGDVSMLTAPSSSGPQSLSGSFVVLDPADQCVVTSAAQTFCFRTETFTTDFEYAYTLYLNFPADWTVTDVGISGTPVCDAGSWGSFAWSTVSGNPYEIRIDHPRYMSTTDHCVATYCVDVTSGSPGQASWYWNGDGYGTTPHNPCSSDGYTPSDGSATCDEAVEPPAALDACDPGVYLTPAVANVGGCAGSPTDQVFAVLNATGSDATFDLAYDVPSGLGVLGGPANVFVANGGSADITATMTTQVCLYPETPVAGVIGISGNAYADSAGLIQTTSLIGGWTSVPNSAPGWAGAAYPVDSCTAVDGSGHIVTYVLGDTSGNGLAGLWGYDQTTESWAARASTGTPSDRWAPDWAYDPDSNLCYLTGGATAPGGGDITEAFVFNPVTATFAPLPPFTSPRDFHDSWVATVDGVRYLCIGGGVDVPGVPQPTTQCYDLTTAPGSWETENSILGGYPNGGSWGSADGVFRSPGADQMWVVAGIIGSGVLTSQAIYFDDADNSWHTAPDVPVTRYRVEGDFFGDAFYLIGGSSGGFAPTDTVYRAVGIGGSPSWQELPPVPNARMDNLVAAGPSPDLRSLDGYGSSDLAYVDVLDLCTACNEIGILEGTVFDSVTGGQTCQPASVAIGPWDILTVTDGSGAYGPLELIASSELGPYDVTASAPGHTILTATGVTIVTSMTTTQDFVLTRPALEVAPTLIETSALTGTATTEPVDLSNIGHDPLEFHFVEAPPMVSPMIATDEPNAVPAGVSADVWTSLLGTGSADYLVYFDDRPDLEPAIGLNREARGQFVISALRNAAARSQESARRFLAARGVEFRPFWIANVIAVSGSDRETLEGLLALPEVYAIRPSRVYQLYEPAKSANPPIHIQVIEANLNHVGADQVWGMGFDGTGIVVANIDTGVRYTHEVLVDHYRGNLGGGSFDHDYNWLDPVSSSPVPLDDHGHGSHTMGTMVGDDGGTNQTGMAPGADWIACRACSAGGGCPAAELLTCAEWIVAPYPIGNPAAADPDLRPQVVNNSWGDCDTAYDGWFQGVVDAWHAAGIYPVFSNGNASNCGYSEPPGCNTVGNPGRYGNVTSVGSTGQADGAYAPHSNWGPTDALDTVNPAGLPTIKPQVVAPGVNIRSATADSDTSYGSWAGTSMSAPHVSGLIALMWQAAPCLIGDYAATETIIQETANPIPYPSACGGEGPGNVPNQATGWGEIDADSAVLAAVAHCDTDWLPWVTESPVSGVVPASSDAGINFNFNCMADGDNHGTVRVLSNDPCHGPVDMSLTLHCGPATAAMTVVKETIPPATMQSFSFTGDLSGAMHDGHSLSSSGLLPGTFTVSETPVPGWTVDGITCDDGDSTGDVGTATATFRLGIAEAVTCTFVNRQDVGACGYPDDLVLGDHAVVGTAAWHACHTIAAADGFVVDATGVVTFRAGTSITFGNGFAVHQGGSFTASIDPTLE